MHVSLHDEVRLLKAEGEIAHLSEGHVDPERIVKHTVREGLERRRGRVELTAMCGGREATGRSRCLLDLHDQSKGCLVALGTAMILGPSKAPALATTKGGAFPAAIVYAVACPASRVAATLSIVVVGWRDGPARVTSPGGTPLKARAAKHGSIEHLLREA